MKSIRPTQLLFLLSANLGTSGRVTIGLWTLKNESAVQRKFALLSLTAGFSRTLRDDGMSTAVPESVVQCKV